MRTGTVDLLTCNKSSFFEDSEHIFFVVLHRGKGLPTRQFTANGLYFQRRTGAPGFESTLRRWRETYARCLQEAHQSLHGYALGEIAWFIDVAAQFNRQMICEELKGDDIQNGHHVVGRFRQQHDVVGDPFKMFHAISAC